MKLNQRESDLDRLTLESRNEVNKLNNKLEETIASKTKSEQNFNKKLEELTQKLAELSKF